VSIASSAPSTTKAATLALAAPAYAPVPASSSRPGERQPRGVDERADEDDEIGVRHEDVDQRPQRIHDGDVVQAGGHRGPKAARRTSS